MDGPDSGGFSNQEQQQKIMLTKHKEKLYKKLINKINKKLNIFNDISYKFILVVTKTF